MRKVIAILLAGAVATPAFAAGDGGKLAEPPIEPPVMVPAPVALYDWTGPYAGVTLGFGRVTSNTTVPNASGVGGVLHLGYNMDFGNWVAGGQLDLLPKALASLSSDGRRIGNSGQIKLRAGPKFGADGRTFAFGTLGLAQVRSTDGAGGSFTDNGWMVGVGAAHAVQDNLFVTGEINHHRFSNVGGGNNQVRANSANLGVSFRF
jgi:outer membrane immunogenic protein